MNKYLRFLKAERRPQEQTIALHSQRANKIREQWKAAIAAAEKDLVAVHTSSRPFIPAHRAAGDKFVAA